MDIGRSELALPATQGARVTALRLLDDATTAAPKLEHPDAAEALHDFRVAVRRLRSWLDAFDDDLGDVVPGKAVRRLKKLANATNPGRDREVQLEWLTHAGAGARGRRRHAVAWMRDHLRDDDASESADLRATVRKEFPKARDALVRALSREVPVFDSAHAAAAAAQPTLAEAIADRIGPHLVALHEASSSIQSMGDESAAHAARIAAKRLRYLVEPAGDVEEATALLDHLRGLQDALGALHDGHVMAEELCQVMERAAVAEARIASAKALGRQLAAVGKRDARYAALPRDGLASLMRVLRADVAAAYRDARSRYGGSGAESLEAAASALVKALRAPRPLEEPGAPAAE